MQGKVWEDGITGTEGALDAQGRVIGLPGAVGDGVYKEALNNLIQSCETCLVGWTAGMLPPCEVLLCGCPVE